MKEFQEENLFQGVTQSQGFSPLQAPDTSRFLRENMGQIDRNFANLQNQQQAALDAKLEKQLKTMEMFGQFSKTAMEFAQTMGKAYVDNQIIEGQNKARSLGKTLNYGINPQQEQIFNQTLSEEKQNQAEAANAALEMNKQGAPAEAINYIKSLPQYQRIGAYQTYYANKGKTYSEYLKKFVQRDDIKLPRPDGNGTFTPKDIDDDPVLMQMALSQASKLFMAEEVGIGANNNPTALAAKSLYEEMDKAEDAFMNVVRRNKTINDSENMVFQATETFKANGDINAYVSAITGSLDNEGNMRNRSQALDFVFENIVSRYGAGDKEALKLLDVVVEGDPQGKTFRQRFENRMMGTNGIDARIEALDRKERLQAEEEESAELKRREDNFEEASKIRAAERRPFTDKEIDFMLEEAMAETGKTADAFPWFKNYKTQEKRDAKLESDYLDDLRKRRGYLIESDLRGVSSTTYRNYANVVKDDQAKATLPSHYQTDANKKIDALADEKFKLEGDDVKTNEWQDVTRRARDKYRQYINQFIDSGMSQQEAQSEALKRVEANFKAGSYNREPTYGSSEAYRKKLETARVTMSKNQDISKYILPNTNAELKQLAEYNKGQGEIPKLYYDLARGQKNLTAWDIANAQYKYAYGSELGKNDNKLKFDRLDPAVQMVISYKPTPKKVLRAQTSSFRTQTSSLPNPTLKRAADIISKYESAGSGGYNAVNQGGEAGGTKIPAGFYSGDFRNMPQHKGRDLTSLTIGEVMDLQADPGRSKLSDADWVKQGKLHAVGRYQFIGSTLRGLVQRLGIPRTAKFTPELQDQLFLSLLKSGGLSQWVGPTNYATAEEKAIIEQARAQL